MPDKEQEPSELKPISVYQAIMLMVDQMATIAWQKLGLQPDLATGRIAQDLEEAKVAIDLTAHLASFIEPQLEEADRREIHNLVRNLRLNYVQKQQEASASSTA